MLELEESSSDGDSEDAKQDDEEDDESGSDEKKRLLLSENDSFNRLIDNDLGCSFPRSRNRRLQRIVITIVRSLVDDDSGDGHTQKCRRSWREKIQKGVPCTFRASF